MLLKLLGAPVTGPVAGFKFILEQIATMAENELDSEEHVRDELLLLQLQLDEGEITEEAYAEREADIIARLRGLRAQRRAEAEQRRAEADDRE